MSASNARTSTKYSEIPSLVLGDNTEGKISVRIVSVSGTMVVYGPLWQFYIALPASSLRSYAYTPSDPYT